MHVYSIVVRFIIVIIHEKITIYNESGPTPLTGKHTGECPDYKGAEFVPEKDRIQHILLGNSKLPMMIFEQLKFSLHMDFVGLKISTVKLYSHSLYVLLS